MITRIRNYALIALGIGAFYFLLTHHFIFRSFTNFDLLDKTEPTLKYTFISIRQLNPYKLLSDKNIRDAGFAEYMLDNGLVREDALDRILTRIEAEYEEEFEE